MKRTDRALPAAGESTPAAPVPVIRRAVVADARPIAEISVTAWQAAYRGILADDFLTGLGVRPRELAWAAMLESDVDAASPAWVAERDGVVVGYVSTGPPRDADVQLSAAEVYAIYVLPAAWRNGVGRALLGAAVEEWRTRRVATLLLWVLEDNARGRRFYESMGWQPDGHRQEIDLGGISVVEVRYALGAVR
jgi:GNAT superfamily N-acetyltransferase